MLPHVFGLLVPGLCPRHVGPDAVGLEWHSVATVQKRRGKWRVQIRRNGHALSKTFYRKTDADEWAREAEHSIDKEIDPSTKRISRKDTFASLIDLHIEDLHAVGKPLRRSKRHVLERLREELGETPLANLTRERLILYGRQRAKEGAGPATLAVDISFIGTVLTHAAAVHGIAINTESVKLARVALRRLGLVGAGTERDRRPTEKELEKLFAYFEANDRLTIPMTRVVRFAIATAMRIDEIFRIEWETLDAKTRTILVPDRKDPRKKDWPAPGFVDTQFRCLMKLEGREWRRQGGSLAGNTN